MSEKQELVIIAPVYNESSVLEQFVRDWITHIRLLSINFKFRIYDDGSIDNTAEIIKRLQKLYPELEAYTKGNSGHGPTITEAYEQTDDFFWVFQIDSDHELPVSGFTELWKDRADYDFLLGQRLQRDAPLFRRFLTDLSLFFVSLLFGNGVHDINSPYRLMRSAKLKEFLLENKKQNFAPNALMSAFAIKKKWRIKTIFIKHLSRKKIKGTGYSAYLLSGAINTMQELIRLSIRK